MYRMLVKKEWMGMNRMHLTSAVDNIRTVHILDFFRNIEPFQKKFFGVLMSLMFACLQTQKFGISLMVRDFGPNGRSNFFFRCIETMKKADIDIGRDDMLMNYTHPNNMVMNGGTPWWGARKKDPCFSKSFLTLRPCESQFRHPRLMLCFFLKFHCFECTFIYKKSKKECRTKIGMSHANIAFGHNSSISYK